MEVLRSGEIASKYHQSQELLLTEDSCGPSRLYCDETKLAKLLPVAAVAGIFLISKIGPLREEGEAVGVDAASAARSQ